MKVKNKEIESSRHRSARITTGFKEAISRIISFKDLFDHKSLPELPEDFDGIYAGESMIDMSHGRNISKRLNVRQRKLRMKYPWRFQGY